MPRKPLPAKRLLVAALFVVVGSAAPALAAPVSGDGIDVALAIEPSAAFDKPFLDSLRGHLDRMLEHALGADGTVRRVDHPRLTEWLLTHSLEELTPDDCLKLGCSDVRKTLLLRLVSSWLRKSRR